MYNEPKINVIHDCRRIEKYEPLIQELEKQKVAAYEIWPCLIKDDVVKSINLSHKMIVQDAKDKGLLEVCIAEDDLFFTSDNGWKYFLNNKPKLYDIYLAATYIVTKPLKHVCGFHLYMVHEKFYDKFLSVPDNVHIDTAMDNLGDIHFCYPFPALQRAGFSANNAAVCDYNKVLNPEDIYQ